MKENDWGFNQFITQRQLLKPSEGFIVNDTVHFEVHIRLDRFEPQPGQPGSIQTPAAAAESNSNPGADEQPAHGPADLVKLDKQLEKQLQQEAASHAEMRKLLREHVAAEKKHRAAQAALQGLRCIEPVRDALRQSEKQLGETMTSHAAAEWLLPAFQASREAFCTKVNCSALQHDQALTISLGSFKMSHIAERAPADLSQRSQTVCMLRKQPLTWLKVIPLQRCPGEEGGGGSFTIALWKGVSPEDCS